MPVLAVTEIPGGNAALDEALTEAWRLTNDPPAGNSLRMSGPMEGGWRVISLWDSAEHCRRFFEERLHVTLEELGAGEPTITLWEIETLHRFD